ncbi:MAG: hypothetical protein A2539_01495 [Elusimicrobia bacterium RIFOXYD2_FULL_34_15]|nr:MAG: hypothetical protein A2539_01495 [Elusimicrobia bacterium RIFOXYD2_FULL_34_15]
MVIGKGYENRFLSDDEISGLMSESIESAGLSGKKVLVIIPDHSRTAPIGKLFKMLYKLLAHKAATLDFLLALGTHPPMTDEQIYQRVEITAEEHKQKYSKVRFFNHHWKEPDALTLIGTIPKEEISKITDNAFSMPVKIVVNKKVLDYDHLLIMGPVFPHEVVGFSGGNKYIFPGIAGQEIIDFFHWLGAVITNPLINGHKYTSVRKVIDCAVSHLKVKRSAFCLVVKGEELAGLYYGSPEEAWFSAADLSDKVHITYKDKPYNTVLSCAPKMYDDIWTAGKCMYKLEPVVADGGTLIIYAPHIDEISYSHGKIIDQIGYHTRDYFVKQWDKFKHFPWGVVAHSTHVKGIGSFENNIEKPRVNVVLATKIPEERCRKVNLGYMNPDKIKIEDYKDKEDKGILYVAKAGEILYRLKDK